MSNDDQKTITINLLVIGDEGVGKKSFISRLNTMPCTHSYANRNKFKPKEEKKQKKEEDEEENQDEVPKKKEPVYIPPPSSNQLEFKLGSTILTIQAYIIDGATQCKIDEDLSSDDEDEEIFHEYHIKFSMSKKCILNYLRMFAENNNDKNTNEDIFLFMYDLSDFTTFERMMLYYDSLNKRFKLHENKAKCVIIGNKSEKKMLLTKEDTEKMDSFFNLDESFKKFEISNKLHFNFSKFLGEFIENIVDEPYDKDKLKQILVNKFSFNKAKRNLIQVETDVPGPNKYYTNVYAFYSMEERNEILNTKKKRFNDKIFVNKRGPLFYSNKKDEERRIRNSEYEGHKKPGTSQIQTKIENNFVNGNKGKGATFGEAPTKYNLKSERTKRIDERNKEYLDAFGENILTSIGLPYTLKREDNYLDGCHNRKYQYQQNLLEQRKTKMGKYLELRDKNYEKLNQELIAKSQAYKDKYVEYDEKKSKQRYLDMIYSNNAKILENINSHTEINALLKKEAEEKNLPKMYDVRGNLFNPKKGAIILGKRKYKEKENNNAPYMQLKTDFDYITQHSKQYSIGYSPRYKDEVLKHIPQQTEKVFDESKFERFKENREKSEKKANTEQFLSDCRLRKARHDDLMKAIKDDAKTYHESLLMKYYSKNPQDMEKPPEINYSLVEESAPQYTLKGRHEKKPKQEIRENKDSYFDLNGKKIPVDYDNLEKPDIAAVRWKIPSFSFGKDERFDIDKYKQTILENRKFVFKDEEKDENDKEKKNVINALSDRTDFCGLGLFDSKSNRSELDNQSVRQYPGPGQYKIKGFAEEIVEKYEKINNMRKLAQLGKEDKNKEEEKKDKEKTVTGASVNEYMEEFNKEQNKVISREKSEIGEDIDKIREESQKPVQTTDYGTQNTESKDIQIQEEKKISTETKTEDEVKIIDDNNKEEIKVDEQKENTEIENENQTKPDDVVKINEEQKEEISKENNIIEPQNDNQTKPEDEVKFNEEPKNEITEVNNELQSENQTKPEDAVKINNNSEVPQETLVEGYVEPQENETKPENSDQINETNKKKEEVAFEEPIEEA